MKTWQDAIDSIDPQNTATGTGYFDPVVESDITVFSELFGIGCEWSNEFSTRMLKHWVVSWVCADTRVGLAVYCLDKVPVAVSFQEARKCDEHINFLSHDAMNNTRDCVFSYIDNDLRNGVVINTNDLIDLEIIKNANNGHFVFYCFEWLTKSKK